MSTNRDDLLAAGRRAAYKLQCDAVIVAPDHAGGDNYHVCGDKRKHTGNHSTGSGYEWTPSGMIVARPAGISGGGSQ